MTGTTSGDEHPALDRAHALALTWLASLDERRVPPSADAGAGGRRPRGRPPARDRRTPEDVIDHLARACEPGLTAMPSGRFFGFVIGGTHPAALAADWLVSAWDQNAGLRTLTPAHTAVEEIAEAWLLDLLGLPAESAVGFVTGGTMANFTCLAAGRDEVLRRAGWDVASRGLVGSPGVRVLVGAERHDTVDLALRYLGLGLPEPVAADDQGRIDPARPAARAGGGRRPAAGRRACRPATSTPAPSTRSPRRSRWPTRTVRGCTWTGPSGSSPGPRRAHRHLVAGVAAADSWATDAHKTLNVPYDCGLAIVRDRPALRAAMGMHGDYLIHDAAGEPFDKVPEISRRGRAFTVWAVLRAARSRRRRRPRRPALRPCGRDRPRHRGDRGRRGPQRRRLHPGVRRVRQRRARPARSSQGMLDDGTAWMTGSRWHDRAVLRVSVSNWSTSEADVERSLAALRAVAAG